MSSNHSVRKIEASIFLFFLFLGANAGSPCMNEDVARLPFCNSSLPFAQRARDLIGRLTIEEKIHQMGEATPAIERFHIDAYHWWSEGLHGVSSFCTIDGRCPTSYPMPINAGATFNMQLVNQMASQISTEARRLFFERVNGLNASHKVGLDLWAPNINIFRDPRWGRGQETPGEDPFLNGQYAIAYVRGLQEGEDTRYMKVAATLKHFAAYSLERWENYVRFSFDANVSVHDLFQTYLPAFQAGVESGQARSVMCSYNSINHVPACASQHLLTDILRGKWDFSGYVVSDCDAIMDIYKSHHYTETPAEASSVSIKAGTNLDCGSVFNTSILDSLNQGLLDEEDLDNALFPLFETRFLLGLFDDWRSQPYMRYPPTVVGQADHVETALQIAKESLVLLKNEQSSLPLENVASQSLALLGPFVTATSNICGNYFTELPHIVSPLEGISKLFNGKILTSKGCDVNSTSTSGFDTAIEMASAADAAILFMGIDGQIESEGMDRSDITLPGVQEHFIQAIASEQQRTILVLFNGGSLDLSFAATNPSIVGIVEAFYPCMKAGEAIASVLFGDYNPSGRLPVTIYKQNFVDNLSMADMRMSSGPGRTYRFFTGDPVYPFGFGLSYTTFFYEMVSQRVENENSAMQVRYALSVTNNGTMAGDVSILAYISFVGEPKGYQCPRSQLFWFEKVSIEVGMSKIMVLAAAPSALLCVRLSDGYFESPPGLYSIRFEALELFFHFDAKNISVQ